MDLVSPQTISTIPPKSEVKESLPSNKGRDIQIQDETIKREASDPSVTAGPALKKDTPSSLPPPSSGSFLDDIKAKGGAAALKKDTPLSSSGSFLDEIKAKGGAAALKKRDNVNIPPPVPELPGNDFLAEIRAKGGAASLKKN